jgi:hypothetical protein
MTSAAPTSASERLRGYAGWWISLALLVIVFAVGAGLWFYFHR